MKRLTHSDWAAISSALPALYSQRNLATLAFAWMRVAKELTAADLLITSELDTSSYAIKRPLAYPYDTQVAKLAPAFIELSAKVPQMIAGYSEGVLFGPATSRMTQRQFERTDVFNEFHRPLGVRYQFAGFATGMTAPHIGFIIERKSRDYSSRDETVLRHLAEHFGAAAQNVRAFTALAGEVTALTHATDLAGKGVVFLTRNYALHGMTGLASKLFAKFFADWRNRSALPDAVTRWMRGQVAKVAEQRAIGSPIQPLKVGTGQQQLTIRLLLDPVEPPMLVVSETRESITIEALRQFGLTPRETEVLYWLVQGKTNAEIGVLLGTTEGTARKHVERILLHFGTNNRTATVLYVMEHLQGNDN